MAFLENLLDPMSAVASLGETLIDRFIPDPVAKAKAKAELARQIKDGELEELELMVRDRDSARKREMVVQDSTPKVLAYGISLGFFGILSYILVNGVPEKGGDALLILLGALSTAWTGIMAYYYGSSIGSKDKTNLMNGMK